MHNEFKVKTIVIYTSLCDNHRWIFHHFISGYYFRRDTKNWLEETPVSYQRGDNQMGSTDSAGDSHRSGAGSCGLVSSLFPNSCRGRAEAFARRLHRRLTSLGTVDVTNGDNDDTHYNEKDSLNGVTETAWLQSSNYKTNTETTSALNSNNVLDHQPRHSPEFNLYYDSGLSQNQQDDIKGDIESPDEIVSPGELDNLLVNRTDDIKTNHCDDDENRDSESGYIFSSPLDASPSNESNTEAYFDPESSEGDKIHTEDFYDPVYTSESDAACDLSYDQAKCDCQKPPGRRRIDLETDQKNDDTSESSSSINEHTVDELKKTKTKRTLACSSDESLNDVACSSLDTTSPSHESLWSTFDDSTVSQDENPSLATLSATDNVTVVTKSHSDSELLSTSVCVPMINLEMPSANDVTDFSNELVRKKSDAEIQLQQIHLGDGELRLKKDDNSTYSSTIDIPGALVVECMMMSGQSMTAENILKSEVKLSVSENSDNNCVDMPRLLERLSSSSRGSCDKEIKDNGEASSRDDENDDEKDEEEEEEEKERPQRVRRCSSLKTGKTPPGTPGRKKIVRFADVLGLDLADVRTFLDEIPKVPNSAFSDLVYDDVFVKESSPNFYDGNLSNRRLGSNLNNPMSNVTFSGGGLKADKMLMPLFQQPGGLPNYLDLVRDRQVCLENVIVQDAVAMCIQGTVRVRNLDFHKSVHIRYTLDSWRNFSDLQASYVNNSCDGFSDKFTFQLYCHTLKIGNKLELAVRFQCKGAQYWDNNDGMNYCFQCLPLTPTANYIPITSSTTCATRDWSPTFY